MLVIELINMVWGETRYGCLGSQQTRKEQKYCGPEVIQNCNHGWYHRFPEAHKKYAIFYINLQPSDLSGSETKKKYTKNGAAGNRTPDLSHAKGILYH